MHEMSVIYKEIKEPLSQRLTKIAKSQWLTVSDSYSVRNKDRLTLSPVHTITTANYYLVFDMNYENNIKMS